MDQYLTCISHRLELRVVLSSILLLVLLQPEGWAEGEEYSSRFGKLELVGVVSDKVALNRAHDVELRGDFAYVAGKGGSLAVVNVREATAPQLVASIVDPIALEDAETILLLDDVLLLGARDLLAIDVSNPAKPRLIATIRGRPRVDRINGMVQIDEYVFAANKNGFIDVFEVSDPRQPRLSGVFDTRLSSGLDSPHDIAAFGDRIVIVNAADDGETPVCAYRVFDEKGRLLPVDEWKPEGLLKGRKERLSEHLGGANRIAMMGNYACVGAFVCDRFAVVDLGRPEHPVQLANLPVCDIDGTGLEVVGKVAFVSGGECVEAIDLSDPTWPVSIAQFRGGGLFSTRCLRFGGRARFDNGHDLVYRDGYLYVTAQNDHRLGILQVKDRRLRSLCAGEHLP